MLFIFVFISEESLLKGQITVGNREGNIRIQAVIITVQMLKRKACVGKQCEAGLF